MGSTSGTFTFLYTDIENSSGEWESSPAQMAEHVALLNKLTQATVVSHQGEVFKSLGDGLAAVFTAPHQALHAAVELQTALLFQTLPSVRIGIHTGFAEKDDVDYHGTTLNRVSRITNMGHGGQILASAEAYKLAVDRLESGITCKDLGEQVLAGHRHREQILQICAPGLMSDFPKLRGTKAESTIPMPDRAFVGRSKEKAELLQRLAQPSQRLITILGFGGMGKTTLAQVCASKVQENFTDGVWWIPCESLTSLDQLVAGISTVLDFETDASDPLEGLCGRIDEKQMLLVLDCCEGLASANVSIDALLQNCRNLQILATSRVILGSPYEFEFELRGMVDGGRKRPNLNDAIELFTNTAKQAKINFEVSKANRRLVAELVLELECIPLAIILVASRLRHRTLDELCEQVKSSILEAARTVDGRSTRHSNLWQVIDLSFGLLSAEEQEVLTKLSVFCGGFFLSDAEAIVGTNDLVGKISRLRDNSMVLADSLTKQTRYRQLDSVREYAREVVDPKLWQIALAFHSQHFKIVAKQIRDQFDRAQFSESTSLLTLEGGNLRQAVHTAILISDNDGAKELAWCLCRPLLESGQSSDFQFLAQAALEKCSPANDKGLMVELLGLIGMAARRAGSMAIACQIWEQKFALCEGNVVAQADCIGDMLGVALSEENKKLAMELWMRYKRLEFDATGDECVEHQLLCARCAAFLGDVEEAMSLASRIEAQFDLSCSNEAVFYVARSLAEVHRVSRRFESSIRIGKEFLLRSVEGRYMHRVAQALIELALSYVASGDNVRASQALSAIHAIPRSAAPNAIKQAKQMMKKHNYEEVEFQDWIQAANLVLAH